MQRFACRLKIPTSCTPGREIVKPNYEPVRYGEFLKKKVGSNFDTGKGKIRLGMFMMYDTNSVTSNELVPLAVANQNVKPEA
jgi:hypothetical protein